MVEEKVSKYNTTTVNDAIRAIGGIFNLIPLITRSKDITSVHEIFYAVKIIKEYVNERSSTILAEIGT
jgi:hypothetical protein